MVKDALLHCKTCPFMSLFITVWYCGCYEVIKKGFLAILFWLIVISL